MKETIPDEAIAAALLSCGTQKAAAARLGISERTIYNRLRDNEFLKVYAAARADLLRVAVAGVALSITDALNTVAEIMNDKDNNAAVRLQAAQTIINSAVKLSDKLTESEKDKNELRNINRNKEFYGDMLP